MRNFYFTLCFIGFVVGMVGQDQGQGQTVRVTGIPNVNRHGDPPYLLEERGISLINGKDLEGWKFQDENKAGSWTTTKGVYRDQAKDLNLLRPVSGRSDRLVYFAYDVGGSNLISMKTVEDMELYVEYLIPEKSASGIYKHDLYEVQIWNSYGIEPRLPTDKTGMLYTYIDRTGTILPIVHAERPQGQWNAFHIWFQAPCFAPSGTKIENAKFIRVLFNGELIHENQERIVLNLEIVIPNGIKKVT